MSDTSRLHTVDQLLETLDHLIERSERGDRSAPGAAAFWTEILTREGHPLATDLPDEPLVDWHTRGLLGDLSGARVLDIGCGAGRNTRWFATQGATVHGVDLAADLLDRIRPDLPPTATVTALDILRDPLPSAQYDVIYDSGCFHHIAPHRRLTYLERVLPALSPGAHYAIITFAAGQVETPTDLQILTTGDTAGGMSFSLEDLRSTFNSLTPIDLRPVRPNVPHTFGAPFLNAALFTN
ncbi:class I SAM-dependent methyltransferase [Kribbella sp. NPDC056951]|uniref:class I SAM-dependent methyltransferase n=1 Tax=Kribbella sp. NPDC056951 TaxID=3345978 RepID=UPI00363D073D